MQSIAGFLKEKKGYFFLCARGAKKGPLFKDMA